MSHPRLVFLLASFAIGCSAPPPAPTKRTLTTSARPAPSSPWPTFQHDNARTGTIDAPPLEDPKIVWRANIGIQGWLNNPILVGDRVIVGTQGTEWNKPDPKDGVWALRASDGEQLWFVPTNQDAGGVAYAQGVVVATSEDRLVRGIDWLTGRVLWTFRGTSKMYTNPLLTGGLALVGEADGFVHALRLQTGEVVWSAALLGKVRGGFAAEGGTAYVGTQRGHIYALDVATGRERWHHDMRQLNQALSIYAAPTVTPHGIAFTYARDTTDPKAGIFMVDPTTGAVLWSGHTHGSADSRKKTSWANVRSSPSFHEDLLLFGEAYSNEVVALRAKKGHVGMLATMGSCMFQHWASPAQARRLTYLPRFDGALYAFSNDYGLARWRLFLGRAESAGTYPDQNKTTSSSCLWSPNVGKPLYATPAISPAGNVYVGTGEGYLFKLADRTWAQVAPL